MALPSGRRVVAPESVALGALDRVVALHMLDGEADAESLHVVGLGDLGSAGLSSLGPGLEPSHVLGAGERQKLTRLGRIDHVGGVYRHVVLPDLGRERDGGHPVAIGRRGDGAAALQQCDPAGRAVWREHLLQHTDGDARLMAQLRHPAGAGVEVGAIAGSVDQRIAPPVDVADAVAQCAVAGGDAELLDPGVLVRRHRLRGQLATDPRELLGQDHVRPAVGGGKGGGDASQSCSDDEDVGGQFTRGH